MSTIRLRDIRVPFNILKPYKNGDGRISIHGTIYRVVWCLILTAFTCSLNAQRIDPIRYDPIPTYTTFASQQDTLLWNYEHSEGEWPLLNYTRTSAPYWEGSYLLESHVFLKFRWLEISPSFTSGRSTFAYRATHTVTGECVLIFITVEYIHIRPTNKRFSHITGIQVFPDREESLQPWE